MYYPRVLTYAATVVVVLMGADFADAAAIGRTLAAALDWPFVAGDDPHVLHAIIATVLGRREHLLAATLSLTDGDRRTVRGELLGVRFLDLAEHSAVESEILATMCREFGV